MMNDERYVRKGYKIWDTYSDREVQELNYRSQSDYMCEVLNEKESRINTLVKENEQLKEQVQILNKCCKHKLSDEAIKQAYADLNRREREKHSQGNATYTAKINQNEVIY